MDSGSENHGRYETIQFFVRKHWTRFLRILVFGLILGIAILLLFAAVGSVLYFFRAEFFYPFFSFVVILVTLFYFNSWFLHLFNYYFDVMIVTESRIIASRKTVYLKNDNDAVDLTKIQDIGVQSRGVFRNYLNYGSLIITLSTSMPPVTITCIPNPHYYLEKVNRVKREHILKRQESRRTDYLQPVEQLTA